MAIKINFDVTGTPELPTMILAKRNGAKLGQINGYGIVVAGNLNSAHEIQFEIDKYDSYGNVVNLWDEIKDFRLLWCKEWDTWFEMTVELDETTETTKTIFCTQLGQAELSQIYLFDIQINTEDDIAREDYDRPTVLYDPDHPEASLLNRITEHAPHYTIDHVDSAIKNIQRTFTFDGVTIYDAFQEIAEEIDCIFLLDSNSDSNGSIYRSIKVYDLESHCNNCGYRGDFEGDCPECGSSFVTEGYGDDTTIFIEADELADEIQFSTDTGSVKNCFKLVGGDDLMTATIRNCNPNGSDRLWYFTDEVYDDMSTQLSSRIKSYNNLYESYQNDYVVSSVPSDIITEYNNLVTKYQIYNSDLEPLPTTIQGYPALMEAYYNTVDFALYLQSALMPDASLSDTSAEKEAAKLTATALSGVAVADVSVISSSSADNAVLAMAKVLVDSRYQVKINTSSWGSGQQWTGNFVVTNYSDEDDTATSNTITITITDDYEEYLRQMIEKELNKLDSTDYSIVGLFELDYDDFCAELKKYCRDSLSAFYDAAQACLNILIEQGVGDKETWGSTEVDADSNLYEKLYVPYYNKLVAVEAELKLRDEEIAVIKGTYDENGYVDTYGVQTYLLEARDEIQDALDFEEYLGADLWLEFSAFRREDKYENDNYISDGLDNSELFENAELFLEVASKELYKSAELQHSIASSLKNLLAIDKFAPLVDYFVLGNWLRIRVDSRIYKLRLIGYEIDYDDLTKLSVDFSDVMKTMDGMSDKKSVLDQAASMASSYDSTKRQSTLGSKAYDITDDWFTEGLDITNVKLTSSADNEEMTWDSNGLLFRRYDSILDEYEDEQLRIIHSTIAVTDDNWETVKTAIGGFYYVDPETGETKYGYGINGELLIGRLILGENLALYNESGTLKFDSNGLYVTNGSNTVLISPNNGDNVISVSHDDTPVFYVDENGNAYFYGSGVFSGTLEAANGSFSGYVNAEEGYIGNFVITADSIYNIKSSFEEEGDGVYIGIDGISLGEGFSVDNTGTADIYKGTVGGWSLSTYRMYGGSEENGTTCLIQVPRDRDATSGRYWVFAAGGYSHSDHSDCPFRVGSDGETHTSNLYVGETTDNAERNCYVRNAYGRIDLQITVNGNKGLYDYDKGGYIVCKSYEGDNRLGNTSEDTRIHGSTVYVATDSFTSRVDLVVTSDERLKKDFNSIDGYESLFDSITPLSFRYKTGDDKIHFGMKYQDVKAGLEECGYDPDDYGIIGTHKDADGETYGGIAYSELIPLLINEVQKLKKKVRDLEDE